MTSEIPTGDLLTLGQVNLKRRLNELARRSHYYNAQQLTLMQSLLDEFSRKSKMIRAANESQEN